MDESAEMSKAWREAWGKWQPMLNVCNGVTAVAGVIAAAIFAAALSMKGEEQILNLLAVLFGAIAVLALTSGSIVQQLVFRTFVRKAEAAGVRSGVAKRSWYSDPFMWD